MSEDLLAILKRREKTGIRLNMDLLQSKTSLPRSPEIQYLITVLSLLLRFHPDIHACMFPATLRNLLLLLLRLSTNPVALHLFVERGPAHTQALADILDFPAFLLHHAGNQL